MKSALARQGSMSKLHGPRSFARPGDGSPRKRPLKTVTFDKTDEVIRYDVATPEITEETWDQVSLESCDSERLDELSDAARPLPRLPQFVLPRDVPGVELPDRAFLPPSLPPTARAFATMDAPIDEHDDDFDFGARSHDQTTSSPTLPGSHQSPNIDESPIMPLPSPIEASRSPIIDRPEMDVRMDAILAGGSGMSPALPGGSWHRRTGSGMSDVSDGGPEAYLAVKKAYRPANVEDEEPASWRDAEAARLARQDSLQDDQRHPQTRKVSSGPLPPAAEVDRTYSKRRQQLLHMLDPRGAGQAQHFVGFAPIAEEESETPSEQKEPEVSDMHKMPSTMKESGSMEEIDLDSGPDSKGAGSLEEQEEPRVAVTAAKLPSLNTHLSQKTLDSPLKEDKLSAQMIGRDASDVSVGLDADLDFGNDSYWRGGYLREASLEEEENEATTARANAGDDTIGISQEPAAQFAAGISPDLREDTLEEIGHKINVEPIAVVRPVSSSSAMSIPALLSPALERTGTGSLRDITTAESTTAASTTTEGAAAGQVAQTPEKPISRQLPNRPQEEPFNLEDSEVVADGQARVTARPNQAVSQAGLIEEDNGRSLGESSLVGEFMSEQEYEINNNDPKDSPESVLGSVKEHSGSDIHGKLPSILSENEKETSISNPVKPAPLKVLPWDPSDGNDDLPEISTPIIPEQSPERRRLLNKRRSGEIADTSEAGEPEIELGLVQSTHSNLAEVDEIAKERTGDDDNVLTVTGRKLELASEELKETNEPGLADEAQASLSPSLGSSESLDVKLPNPDHDSFEESTLQVIASSTADEPLSDGETQDVRPAAGRKVSSGSLRGRPSFAPISAPIAPPTLSPIATSPFMNTPIMSTPLEESLKGPLDGIDTPRGIDELVSPREAQYKFQKGTATESEKQKSENNFCILEGRGDKQQLDDDIDDQVNTTILSEMSLNSEKFAEFREKTPQASPIEKEELEHIDDRSSLAPHPELDSDLSDFEDQEARNTTRLVGHGGLVDHRDRPPTNRNSAASMLTARTTISEEDVSLQGPSFGEAMASTFQSLISSHGSATDGPGSESAATVAPRASYIVRDSGSFIVATSPRRRARNSRAYEVLGDDEPANAWHQNEIPRNRSLPSVPEPIQDDGKISSTGTLQNITLPASESKTSSYSRTSTTNSNSSNPFRRGAVKADSPAHEPLPGHLQSQQRLPEPIDSMSSLANAPSDISSAYTSISPSSTSRSVPTARWSRQGLSSRISEPVIEEDHVDTQHVLSPVTEQMSGPFEGYGPGKEPGFVAPSRVLPAEGGTVGLYPGAIDQSRNMTKNDETQRNLEGTSQRAVDVRSKGYTSGISLGGAVTATPPLLSDSFTWGSEQPSSSAAPRPPPKEDAMGMLYFSIKSIHVGSLPAGTVATLVIDNGVHTIMSKPIEASRLATFNADFRIELMRSLRATAVIRLSGPAGAGALHAPGLAIGADGSLAKIDLDADLRNSVFGRRRTVELRGANAWATSMEQRRRVVASLRTDALYVPTVSREELPLTLDDAASKLAEAREEVSTLSPRISGLARQFGGDVADERGKQRWIVLDPVTPLLVTHSKRTRHARTLVNLAKATSAEPTGPNAFELRFRNRDSLAFRLQTPAERDRWVNELQHIITSHGSRSRPKWIDATIYETSA